MKEENKKNILTQEKGDEKLVEVLDALKEGKEEKVKDLIEGYKEEKKDYLTENEKDNIETKPNLDVDVDSGTSYVTFDASTFLPSSGYFFKVPEKISIKSELVGKDYSAISIFKTKFNPNSHVLRKFTTNNDYIILSALQDFVIDKFTNAKPDQITFQDKLAIMTFINLSNTLKPIINIPCPENHTFVYDLKKEPIQDIFKTKKLDFSELTEYVKESGFELVKGDDRILLKYELLKDPVLFFEVGRSVFYPAFLVPEDPLVSLALNLVAVNDINNKTKFKQNLTILEKLGVKHLENISVTLTNITLGITPQYGFDFTKEYTFKCPQHNIDVKLTLLEALSSFFII